MLADNGTVISEQCLNGGKNVDRYVCRKGNWTEILTRSTCKQSGKCVFHGILLMSTKRQTKNKLSLVR